MQDNAEGSSAAPGEDVSDVAPEPKESKASGKDSVSYDTYRKTLSEVKKLKEQLRGMDDLATRLKDMEQDKMSAEGKKDEVITTLKAELEKTKKSEKSVFQRFAYKSLGDQVRVEATKQGCVDPEALMRLADLNDVEIDSETFEADQEKLAQIVSEIKASKPYMFSKGGPKINSSLPNGSGGPQTSKPKDISKMSIGEIREKLDSLRK
jgi:hypothetical protein